MSSEDEPELKDLVLECLENQGVLSSIKAQLRASTYLALEKNNKEMTNHLDKKLKDALTDPKNSILFHLVEEFLEYFGLKFSLSVFETESLGLEYQGREALVKSLNLEKDTLGSGPLLLHLLLEAQKKEVSEVSLNEHSQSSILNVESTTSEKPKQGALTPFTLQSAYPKSKEDTNTPLTLSEFKQAIDSNELPHRHFLISKNTEATENNQTPPLTDSDSAINTEELPDISIGSEESSSSVFKLMPIRESEDYENKSIEPHTVDSIGIETLLKPRAMTSSSSEEDVLHVENSDP